MKNRFSKIMSVVAVVAMLASFVLGGSAVSAVGGPATANTSSNTFVGVNLPAATYAGTNVILLAQDGSTLYGAVSNSAGTSYWVVKSVDGGYNWTATTMTAAWYTAAVAVNPQLGSIVDMAVSPAGDGVLYVGFSGTAGTPGSAAIYRIAGDGTGSITSLRTMVNEGDVEASLLYDIDLYFDTTADINYVMAGTDVDAMVLRDAGALEEWIPLGLIDLDGVDNTLGTGDDYVGDGAVEVAFAPDFATSSIIWAIYDTGNDATLGAIYGTDDVLALVSTTGNGNWNTTYDEIVFDGTDSVGSLATVLSAGGTVIDMAFPDNYTSTDPYLYLALNNAANLGNLFLCVIDDDLGISETQALLTVPTDVCSVEVSGDAIIAGASDTNNVYVSNNAGDTFTTVAVFGQTLAQVYMSTNFASDATLYVATSGGNSGLSISKDGGLTYVQAGLIDYTLTTVQDIAFGVDGDDSKAVLVTTNAAGDASVWLTDDATALIVQWGRVISDTVALGGNVAYNVVDAEVSLDGNTVMLYVETAAGTGNFDIYKSSNGGYTYTNWRSLPAAVDIINDWVVEDGSTIYCATTGGFWGTSRFGPATTELTGINLASVSVADDTVVVGTTTTTSVYVSLDGGENWGTAYPVPAGAGAVYTAFDADFGVADADGELLAYVAAANGIVYQLQLTDLSTDADKVDVTVTSVTGPVVDSTATVAGGTVYDSIIVADDNTLYLGGSSVRLGATFTAGAANIAAGGKIQLVSDVTAGATGELTFAVATAISGTVGTFIDGEVLLVIGDNLLATAATTASGTIQVQGATSGATGYITLSLGVNDTISNVSATPIVAGDTLSVNSSNMLCDITGGASASTLGAGMQRLLLHERSNVWESETNTGMAGLWYSNGSNILWTVDSTNTLEAFEDFLSGQVEDVTAVEYQASPNTATKTATLGWTQLRGATQYEIEAWDVSGTTPLLAGTTTYTVPVASRTAGTALSANVTGLSPVTDYDFYVRVNVNSANHSRWSDAASETTGAYLMAPTPLVPTNGMQEASLAPSFVWTVAGGAASYEFELAMEDASFATTVVATSVTATGYTYTARDLEYDTNYYWRVRSVAADGTLSAWSAVQNFHTESEVVVEEPGETTVTTVQYPTQDIVVTYVGPDVVTVTENSPPTYVLETPETETPVYIWIIVAIGAILCIAVIVLIIRTRRVV